MIVSVILIAVAIVVLGLFGKPGVAQMAEEWRWIFSVLIVLCAAFIPVFTYQVITIPARRYAEAKASDDADPIINTARTLQRQMVSVGDLPVDLATLFLAVADDLATDGVSRDELGNVLAGRMDAGWPTGYPVNEIWSKLSRANLVDSQEVTTPPFSVPGTFHTYPGIPFRRYHLTEFGKEVASYLESHLD